MERVFRRIALSLLALSMAIGVGAGVARWTIATSDDFYIDPRQRAMRTPGYARQQQPVADSFWARQSGTADGR